MEPLQPKNGLIPSALLLIIISSWLCRKKKNQRSAKLNNETNDYTQIFHGSFIGKSLVNVTSHIFLEFRREHFQLFQNNYKGPLGHFRVTLCLGLKTSLRTRHVIYEDKFDLHEKRACMWNTFLYDSYGSARRLPLM